jgi:hypothetical protein
MIQSAESRDRSERIGLSAHDRMNADGQARKAARPLSS